MTRFVTRITAVAAPALAAALALTTATTVATVPAHAADYDESVTLGVPGANNTYGMPAKGTAYDMKERKRIDVKFAPYFNCAPVDGLDSPNPVNVDLFTMTADYDAPYHPEFFRSSGLGSAIPRANEVRYHWVNHDTGARGSGAVKIDDHGGRFYSQPFNVGPGHVTINATYVSSYGPGNAPLYHDEIEGQWDVNVTACAG